MTRLDALKEQGIDISSSWILTPEQDEDARIEFCAVVGVPESTTWLDLYYAMIPKSSKVAKITDEVTQFRFSEVIDDPTLAPEMPIRLIYTTWNESYVIPFRILDNNFLEGLWRPSADALYISRFGAPWLLYVEDFGELYFLRRKP